MMTQPCARRFDEELLTGYLDGQLTQGDRQRVELHLSECTSCSRLFAELEKVRQAARDTGFLVPTDEQWRELPRTLGSRLARSGGWALLVAWALAVGAFVLYQLATADGTWWEKAAVFGVGSGLGLLLLSALLDRLHDLPHDRYRRVQK